MRVTILGGWDNEPDVKKNRNKTWDLHLDDKSLNSKYDIITTCREIGAELVNKQCDVVVGDLNENSVDRYVVEGMLGVLEENRVETENLRIRLIEWEGNGYDLFADDYKKPELLKRHFVGLRRANAHAPRLSAKIMSVEESDVVLAIGGLADTYSAGIAAIVARKTVVPIARFGGASQDLFDVLVTRPHFREKLKEDLDILGSSLPNSDLIPTVFRFGGLNKPRIFFTYSGSARETAKKIMNGLKGDLEIVDWLELFEPGRVILDELEFYTRICTGSIILLTSESGQGQTGAPRPNVIFEAGYFLQEYDREKTALVVEKGTSVFSDIAGVLYHPLEDRDDPSYVVQGLRDRFLKGVLP